MQTTTKKTFAIPPLFTEIKYLLAIALPIMGAQLAQSGMGVIDTLMVGRLGADRLAAVALGTSIWMPLFLFLSGVLLGLTPFIAQWLGADTPSEVGPFAFQGFWLGLIISVLSIVIMLFHADILRLMVVPEHLLPLVSDYMLGIMIGFPALGFYQTMRSYTEGLGFTRPVLIISVGMLLFNLVANWVLIYGMGPIPALGVMGCGFATAIAMWGGVLMLWLYIRLNHRYNETRLLDHPSLPRWGEIRKMSAVGVPIGVAIFFEVGLFTTIALFIARLGSTQVAAHQIALNVTSVTFMVPLSLAMALTVRVGNSIGAGGYGYGKRVSLVGTGCTVFACFFTAGIMYFLPGMIAKLYTDQAEVISLAITLLHLAAIFQISDALQVALSGALRGYKDTQIIMPITLFSYWIVGMGLGYVLSLTDLIVPAMGVAGFWYGLIAGLSMAAVLLGWRFIVTNQQRAATV